MTEARRLLSLAGVVDVAPALGVLPEHRGRLFAQHVPLHRDAATFEGRHPLGGLRALVEADPLGVLVAGAAHEVPDARPGGRAEAHRARLRAGDELKGWTPRPAQVEVSDHALGDHDRDYLRVEDRALQRRHQVDAW